MICWSEIESQFVKADVGLLDSQSRQCADFREWSISISELWTLCRPAPTQTHISHFYWCKSHFRLSSVLCTRTQIVVQQTAFMWHDTEVVFGVFCFQHVVRGITQTRKQCVKDIVCCRHHQCVTDIVCHPQPRVTFCRPWGHRHYATCAIAGGAFQLEQRSSDPKRRK